jgi:hypothetical protein
LNSPKNAGITGFPHVSGEWLLICNRSRCTGKSLEINEGFLILQVVCAGLTLLQAHFWGKEDSMYLLFGPAMAALVVIAVIQLRDHFVASR